jgi:peptidoglycan-associated lipoprotein
MTITRGSVLMAAVLMVTALGVAGCPKRPGSAIGSAPTPSRTPSAAASGSMAAAGQGGQASAQAGAGGAKSAGMQPSDFSQLANLKDIRFDFDRYEIRTEDAKTLESNAKWLKANGSVQVLIEGHCDERGTQEYNLALGDRRAKAAQAYLVSQGVSGNRIHVISYGEEHPLCAAHDESCWQMNRRDHFLGGGR